MERQKGTYNQLTLPEFAATTPVKGIVGGTSRAAYRDLLEGPYSDQAAALLNLFRVEPEGLTAGEAAMLLQAHYGISKSASNVSSLLNDMNKRQVTALDNQGKTPYYLFIKPGVKRPNPRPPHRNMDVWVYHGHLRGGIGG